MSKNIIICFDGTCNHPKDAKQEKEWFSGDIEDNGITNILKLHILFGGNLDNTSKTSKQHSFYYSGVGTYGNRFQQIFNAAFASKVEVGKIINDAGNDLKKNYKSGDKIFIFGFSRGAALARRFSSVIDNYIELNSNDEKPIRYLVAFDTVASIGMPNLDNDEKPVSDVVFENETISPKIQEALHLVSLDESRVAFQPTLMNMESRVTEIWFPGAHADVGGGFWYDGLSDITLKFVLEKLNNLNEDLEILNPNDIQFSTLNNNSDYEIDIDDIAIKPNHKGKLHTKDRWFPIAKATLNKRDVRVSVNNTQESHMPTISHSVIDRYHDVTSYRPRAMKGIKHCLLKKDGMDSRNGKNITRQGLSSYDDSTDL